MAQNSRNRSRDTLLFLLMQSTTWCEQRGNAQMYRSFAEYCSTWGKIWWERYLKITERSWVFSPRMIVPSGSILSSATVYMWVLFWVNVGFRCCLSVAMQRMVLILHHDSRLRMASNFSYPDSSSKYFRYSTPYVLPSFPRIVTHYGMQCTSGILAT
jgi:hypothetical protein